MAFNIQIGGLSPRIDRPRTIEMLNLDIVIDIDKGIHKDIEKCRDIDIANNNSRWHFIKIIYLPDIQHNSHSQAVYT